MAFATRSFTRTIQFTRPNNTTLYTVADALSDNATSATVATFTLNGMAPTNGMGGVITGVSLYKSDQDLTGADFDLYLFDTAVDGTHFEDNAAHALSDAELQTCIGVIPLTAASHAVTAGMIAGDFYHRTNLDMHYECAAGSNVLYVVPIVRGAYTPAAQEQFTIRFYGRVG